MEPRRIVYTEAPSRIVGTATSRTFPWAGNTPPHEIVDPVIATERMWWRATGKLAYAPGMPYPTAEQPLLIGDVEHQANLRGVETRVVTGAPEQRADLLKGVDLSDVDVPATATDLGMLSIEASRRRTGRPPMPRDEHGQIIRDQ